MGPGDESLPEFRGRLYGSASSTFVVCLIVVPLKLWCRTSKTGIQSLGWDDALCVVALALANAFFYLGIFGLGPDLGKHVGTEVSPAELTKFLVILFPEQLLYLVCVAANKFALLAFYWRLFSIRAKVPIAVIAAVVAIWLVGLVLAVVFTCEPLAAQWNPNVPGKCRGLRQLYLGGSVPNIITDAVLLVMPLPYVLRLNLPAAQRVMIASIFLLGCFVNVVSVVRLINLMAVNLASPDFTWKMKEVLLWSVVEVNVGLICACLPSLKPAIRLFGLHRMFAISRGTAQKESGPQNYVQSPAFIVKERSRSRRDSSSGRTLSSKAGLTVQDGEEDSFEMINKANQARGTVQTRIEPSSEQSSDQVDWPLQNGCHSSAINIKRDWSVEIGDPNLGKC